MSRFLQRGRSPKEVIDVDAPLPPIDLTGSDDEIVCTGATSQIVCTGASWNTTENLQWRQRENEWKRQEERERAELRERQMAKGREWQRRQQGSASGSGGMRSNASFGTGSSPRSSLAMIASPTKIRTPSAGPSSTIRPEIEYLGTKIQNWKDSEPPRKRPRISVERRHVASVPAGSMTLELTDESEPEWDPGSIDVTMGMDFAASPYEPTITPASSFQPAPQSQPTTRPIRPARREFPQDFLIPKVEPKPDPDIDVEPKLEPDTIDEDEVINEVSNSDEEYERIHNGYDIYDESRWKERKQNTARLESAIVKTIEDWTISDNADTKETKRRFNTSRSGKKVRPSGNMCIWDLLGQIRQPASATKSMQKPSVLKRGPTYGRILSEKAMHVQASFKVAPGAINRIEQHGGWLAIGSSCIGGQADEPDEQPNPYNRSGSVLTWNGEHHILSGHYDKKAYGNKYYAVNDVKFNSAGNCFISAGMDKKVRVWKRSQGSSKYSGGYDLDTYDGIPYEAAFQPGNADSNVVAVGVKDIHVYSSLEPTAKRTKMILPLVTDSHLNHSVGAIRWDNNRSHLLYASSEPQDDTHVGVHKVFDVNKGKARLTFNVCEAGDAMAVGHVLALATRGESNNFLRIFDINGFGRNCAQEVILEPFAGHVSSKEISCIAFSPDGIYLALGRSDNSVHIYDSRMLGSKGVLQKYQHQDARFVSPENSLYGVTNVHWITKRSGQFTLLSGGEDGCVRLWNPMWSSDEPSNGRRIVEVNSDIGFFSVGDPFKEELDLVVGDSSGEVTIFTGLLNFY